MVNVFPKTVNQEVVKSAGKCLTQRVNTRAIKSLWMGVRPHLPDRLSIMAASLPDAMKSCTYFTLQNRMNNATPVTLYILNR